MSDLIPHLAAGYEKIADDPTVPVWDKRMLHLAVAMGSVPSDYFRYYYFGEEYFREAQAQRLTRAGVLLDALPGYWDHYAEQADADGARARPEPVPRWDPRARAGHRRDVAPTTTTPPPDCR